MPVFETVSDIKDITIGVLSSDIGDVNYYLSDGQNISYLTFDTVDSLFEAIKLESVSYNVVHLCAFQGKQTMAYRSESMIIPMHDGTSSKNPTEDFTAKIGMDMKGVKIAIPKEFYGEGIDKEVADEVLKAAETYKQMGAELIECSMPSLKYAVPAYYLISSAEASSNLSRYDGIKYGHRSEIGENFNELICNSRAEGFGSEVKRRILLGNYALSSGYYDAYYGKALALRQKISAEYDSIFEKCDMILTPTTPSVAYNADENVSDPVKMYKADICTVTVNIASLPAISTTCGYNKDGMPVGMSIIGKKFDEASIIGAADAFEKTFAYKAPEMV